jgi:hypothetical protein
MWASSARPGPTRLYRSDGNDGYYIQTRFDGGLSSWLLESYAPDNYRHTNVRVHSVSIADSVNTVNNASTANSANIAYSLSSGNNISVNGIRITGYGGQNLNGTTLRVYYLSYGTNISTYIQYYPEFNPGISCDTWAHFNSVISIASDKRIKTNIKNINNNNSLDKFLLLKPVYYNKIDIINDNKVNCGLIAQDVKEIIPEAISLTNDFIPNIYKVFDIKDDIIETNEDLTRLLLINDIIQIINEKDVKEEFKIIEISSTHIKIDKKYNYNKCFIYGKKIDDYHTLNYNYIYNLHISATQELYNKIKEQENIIKEREIKLKEQQEKIDLLFELLANKK